MTTRRFLSAYGAGLWTRKDSTDSITDIRLPNRRHLQMACCCSNLSALRSLFLQKLRLASPTGYLDQFYRRPQILRRMNRCPTSWRLDPHISKMRKKEPKKSENPENWTTPLSWLRERWRVRKFTLTNLVGNTGLLNSYYSLDLHDTCGALRSWEFWDWWLFLGLMELTENMTRGDTNLWLEIKIRTRIVHAFDHTQRSAATAKCTNQESKIRQLQDWNRQSDLRSGAISWTSLWKENSGIRSSVDFWYRRISFKVIVSFFLKVTWCFIPSL
jgi:hypothetical protein